MMQSRIKIGRRDPAKPCADYAQDQKPRLAGDTGPMTCQVFFFLRFPIE